MEKQENKKTNQNEYKIKNVPVTVMEIFKCGFMSVIEKIKYKMLLRFIETYNPYADSNYNGIDLRKQPFHDLIRYFDIQENTEELIGHALGMFIDDNFKARPCIEVIMRLKRYLENKDSLFLYPTYGIADIISGCSRLNAIYGGTFMLNISIDEILFNQEGKVRGVRFGNEIATAPVIVCDPTYATSIGRVRQSGKIIRAICILNHTLQHTKNSSSGSIIIPQRQLNRHNDIFIIYLSYPICVCPQGYLIAICSTQIETDTPENELQPAFEIIGERIETFIKIYDIFESEEN